MTETGLHIYIYFPIAVYKCLQFGFNLTDFLHNY